ncbi:MAG: hypothetical protein ABWZ52_03770 [Acidimicrobiales bacterium]
MLIDQDPDDVVAKLERLTERRSPTRARVDLPPHPPPPPFTDDTEPEGAAAPTPHGVSLADLHREMDELRDQLDQAFAEVLSHTSHLEQRIDNLTEAIRQQDKVIDELRTTLGWIKDRLMLG